MIFSRVAAGVAIAAAEKRPRRRRQPAGGHHRCLWQVKPGRIYKFSTMLTWSADRGRRGDRGGRKTAAASTAAGRWPPSMPVASEAGENLQIFNDAHLVGRSRPAWQSRRQKNGRGVDGSRLVVIIDARGNGRSPIPPAASIFQPIAPGNRARLHTLLTRFTWPARKASATSNQVFPYFGCGRSFKAATIDPGRI